MVRFPADWLIQLGTMQQEMERLAGYFASSQSSKARFPQWTWEPAIDVYETDDEVALVVEIAGVKEEDIEIVVSRNEFVIRGERKAAPPTGSPSCLQGEIASGPFERHIALPRAVEPRETKASYEDGMVHITLPKVKEERVRIVQVRVV